jgi:peptidoglycan/LPS O-acetylase OafA/YrhL
MSGSNPEQEKSEMASRPTGPARMPSVDGWRALSIALVLGAHSLSTPGFPGRNLFFGSFPILFDGNLGVRFFFVISGFLITYLLIQEYDRNGSVSLRKFYLRRALRILPVYLAFLIVVAVLQVFTKLHQDFITWVGDLTFTANLLPRGIISNHLWSLSVEEQFYLLWPVTFIWLTKRKQYIAWALTMPVIVAIFCHIVVFTKNVPWLVHPLFDFYSSFINFDSLAVGCMAAFALAKHRDRIMDLLSGHRQLIAATLGLYLILLPTLDLAVLRPVWAIFGNLFQAAGFAVLLVTSVLNPRICKPLNWPVIVRLGVVSYSIYIWQEIFCAGPETYGIRAFWWMSFPGWLIPVFIVGFVSYYGFERPLLGLRMYFGRN